MSSARSLAPALLVVLILTTGCSSGVAPASTAPAPQQSPAASPFLNTLERTKALGTARIDVTVRRGDATLIGSGVVDLVKGLGSLTWHDDAGWRTQLDNDRGTFVRTDVWRRSDPTPQSPLADPLALLGSLRVRGTGSVACGDSRCTRYEGTVPVNPNALAAMGYPEADPAPGSIEVVVDVDDRGRIIAVSRTASPTEGPSGGVNADAVSMHVSLHDFGGPLELTSPTLGAS